MFNMDIWELLVVLLIILLVFGGRRLPEIARALGKSVKEFKKGMQGIADDSDESKDTSEPKDISEKK